MSRTIIPVSAKIGVVLAMLVIVIGYAAIKDANSLKPEQHIESLIQPLLKAFSSAQLIKGNRSDQRGGVFVECGALDGETRSNTLTFEKELGWSGILIEGDPSSHSALRNKNRKAQIVPNCLSITNSSMVVTYLKLRRIGDAEDQRHPHEEVLCFPLYTIAKAAGFEQIDYFSLDVEGSELDVLETIPFDKLKIQVMSMETQHIPEHRIPTLKKLMEANGFEPRAKIDHRGGLAGDIIFAQKGIGGDFAKYTLIDLSRKIENHPEEQNWLS